MPNIIYKTVRGEIFEFRGEDLFLDEVRQGRGIYLEAYEAKSAFERFARLRRLPEDFFEEEHYLFSRGRIIYINKDGSLAKSKTVTEINPQFETRKGAEVLERRVS